jgi:hypothetical protein
MPVDMNRMRQSYEEQQKGGDFIVFDQGETLVYVHPPCRDGDEWPPTRGVPYVPVVVHYNVGKNNSMAVSLDPERNPILEHPFMKRQLKKRKIRLTGNCPIAVELDSGSLSDDEVDECRPQSKYLWGLTPLKHRASSREEWHSVTSRPSVAMVGKQVYDGIMEVFFDNGDITDPDAAILVRIIRKGKDRQTKYEVKAEPSSLKKPFRLPSKLRAAISKAMEEESDCDLFRVVASLVKSPAEVEAMLSGVKTSEADDEDDEADEIEADDLEESEEPESKPKKKAAKKTAKKVEPELDLDDLEEEEPEDEEEESEDEEEDEEEESEEPEPKPKKKAAKKAAKADEDDDDLGLADLEAALDDLEEEEQPSPSKKAAKKAAKKK